MAEVISVLVDGREVAVPAGSTVSAAVALAGAAKCRASVTGSPRGPVCGMGICFECRVTVDGVPHRRGCQTLCRPGMEIRTHGPA